MLEVDMVGGGASTMRTVMVAQRRKDVFNLFPMWLSLREENGR